MPDKTRFEREIDEILEKTDGQTKAKPPRQKQFEPFSLKAPKRRSPAKPGPIRFNPGSVIILGVIILAVAAFTPFAKLPLAIAGALTVTVGYVSWFRSGRSSSGRTSPRSKGNRPTVDSGGHEPQVKYWRGRRIEERPDLADSGDTKDRGKIIEFRSPADDLDPEDQDRGKE